MSRIFTLFRKLDEITIELYECLHPLHNSSSLPSQSEDEEESIKEFTRLLGSIPQSLSKQT